MPRALAALPVPTGYDLLRGQYPQLRALAAAGQRLGQLLPLCDQDGVDTIARLSRALWRTLDGAASALDPALDADALVGLLRLRGAWRALWLTATITLAPPTPQLGLAVTAPGLALIASLTIAADRADVRPAHRWLTDAGAVLATITEVWRSTHA